MDRQNAKVITKTNILLLSVLLMACSKPTTNQERAILAIKQYVEKNFPYPDSYENIKYSKLDSGYEYPDTLDIQIEDLREAILIEQQADSVKNAIQAELSQMGVSVKTNADSNKFKDKVTEDKNKLNLLLANPKEKHYYISDKHRAKNKQGVMEINTINYEIDTTFKIIDTN
ncbi:MAG: hypothetical protein ACHQII_05530 [Bacteroidia bacterium]